MDATAPHITPTVLSLPMGEASLKVAEIRLGDLPRGAVVLLSDVDGLDDFSVEIMNYLAEHGYESLAADLSFGADSTGSDEESLAALEHLLDHMSGRGWSREQIGVVGHGHGGRVALLGAASLRIGAAISLSPSGVASGMVAEPAASGPVPAPVGTPWLGLFGELDPGAPVDGVRALLQWLWKESPAFVEIVTYPGVEASFFREASHGAGRSARFDAWQRTVEWLNLRVVPRPSPLAEIWQLREAMIR